MQALNLTLVRPNLLRRLFGSSGHWVLDSQSSARRRLSVSHLGWRLEQTQTQPTQSSGKQLSRADRETTLSTLSGDGWLAHDAATGVYHIGVRSFLELPNYLEASGPSDTVKAFWELS